MRAVIYVGWSRNTEILVDVNEHDSEKGFTYVDCLECNGTGIWDFVEYIQVDKCVSCKGTGKILINIQKEK